MKTIYLLLTIALLNTHSVAYPQLVTYSGKNVPLKVVFSTIQKQTGYGFFYDKNLLNGAKPVTLSVRNLSVSEVLEQVFKHQALDYSIENKTILVSKKKTSNSLGNVPLTAIKKSQQNSEQNVSPKDPAPDSVIAKMETSPKSVPAHNENPDSNQLSSSKSSIINPIKAEILLSKMNGLNNKKFASSPLSSPQIAISNIKQTNKMSGNIPLQVKSQSEQTVSNFLKSLGKYRKAFFAEGSFLKNTQLTGNFDMRLKPGRNDGFGVRAGLGTDMYNIIMPVSLNYLAGAKKSSFEAGIGVTPTLGLLSFRSPGLNDGFISVGYRYQPINEGLMFRANWTKWTSLFSNEPSYDPMLSFSVGYSFYSLGGASGKKNTGSAGVFSGRNKYLFVEFGGNGMGFSANYDVRIKPEQNDGFGLRAGAGIIGNQISIPFGVNYIAGKKRSSFEAGLGITPLIKIGEDMLLLVYSDSTPSLDAVPFLTAGYRLQSSNGFLLRVNSSLILLDRSIWVPFPGISIGYRLNKLK